MQTYIDTCTDTQKNMKTEEHTETTCIHRHREKSTHKHTLAHTETHTGMHKYAHTQKGHCGPSLCTVPALERGVCVGGSLSGNEKDGEISRIVRKAEEIRSLGIVYHERLNLCPLPGRPNRQRGAMYIHGPRGRTLEEGSPSSQGSLEPKVRGLLGNLFQIGLRVELGKLGDLGCWSGCFLCMRY